MALDLSRLSHVKQRGAKIEAQCPACFAAGQDKTGNHLVIFPDGAFACVANPEDKIHRRQIAEIAGDSSEDWEKESPGLVMRRPVSAPATTIPPRTEVCAYPYLDENGTKIYEVVRYEPKDFRPRLPDGQLTLAGITRIPYRLPELVSATTVWLVEGEKDADTLSALGLTATCRAGGSSKWESELTPWFRGKDVILCGDNDEPGRKYIAMVEQALKPVAKSVQRVEVVGAIDISSALEGLSDTEARAMLQKMVDDKPVDPWSLVDLVDFIETQEQKPQPIQIVESFIERGTKVVFGAGSKSKKTWSTLDLGLSVAFGKKFWGMNTNRVKVLHVDFELKPKKLADRVKWVSKAKGIEMERGWLFPLSLRGQMTDPSLVLTKIRDRALEIGAGLITIDPAYKFIAGRDENSAGDVAQFLNQLEEVVVATDAAVVIANHFSKGNQAAKDPMDRIAGSGVWARDADTLFVMTAHEEDDCLTVSPILRNFKEIPEFVVRWNFPLMELAHDLDPTLLKQPKVHNAGLAEKRAKDMARLVSAMPLSYSEFMKKAESDEQIKPDTFKKYFRILKNEEIIEEFQGKWRMC